MKKILSGKLFKKTLAAVLILGSMLSLAACADKNTSAGGEEKTNITYVKGLGPYSELFEEAIIPILERKGYTFKCVEMKLNEADAAINEGDADLSVEQHIAYMEAFNKNSNGTLTALAKIPTVPAALFSKRHSTLNEISDGASVAIPQDEGNQARALVMLQDLGWITLRDGTDYATASPDDIETNKYNIKIKELDTNIIATTLEDFDYGVVTGSIVYNAGLDLSTAVFRENITENFWLQVVVKQADKDTQWAKDVVAAYQSEEFLSWLKENNTDKYNDLWSIPEY